MAFNPTNPLPGAPMTGLTSPTYPLSPDYAPSFAGKQFAITTLGGVQSSVNPHDAARPFTISFFKPAVMKTATLDAEGRATRSPMNVYKLIVRKNVQIDAQNTNKIAIVTTTIEIPAGAETYSVANIRAMLSCHLGACADQTASYGDTVLTGVM